MKTSYLKILLLTLTCGNLFSMFFYQKRITRAGKLDNSETTTFNQNTSRHNYVQLFPSSWYFSGSEVDFKNLQYEDCLCSNIGEKQVYNNEHECSFLANRSTLIHEPIFLAKLQTRPCMLMDKWLLKVPPVHSVILTVWNQERMINKTLDALLKHTHEWWELIVVFDQCRDKSISIVEKIMNDFIHKCSQSFACPNPGLVHIRLVNQMSGVSETSANNIGMRASHAVSSYFILVQDDMIIRQDGWNSILAVPSRLWIDVFSVSGLCGRSIFPGNRWASVGRCIGNSNSPLQMSRAAKCTFYVRDTGTRGPLLLHAARTRLLGYLDEKHYWLNDDEHDLNFRAYALNGWVSGFQPIDFDSPREFGGTRRRVAVPMTAEDRQYRNLRMKTQKLGLGALARFISLVWKNETVMVVLRPGLPPVNLNTYMKKEKNRTNFKVNHDEKRLIPSDVMNCEI